jgi:small subunit ribosomal protein S13
MRPQRHHDLDPMEPRLTCNACTKQKSLETFFGIGNNSSSRLLSRFNIHPTCRVGELANKQVLDLTAVLSEMKIENDLRREVLNDIKRLKETGTYRGRRHALGLPVRGQRTRTQVSYLSLHCLLACSEGGLWLMGF